MTLPIIDQIKADLEAGDKAVLAEFQKGYSDMRDIVNATVKRLEVIEAGLGVSIASAVTDVEHSTEAVVHEAESIFHGITQII